MIQNPQALANQAEMQRQMQVPNDAKVNYQYSTKTVRNLSPDELAKMGVQPRTISQPMPGQPQPRPQGQTTSFQPSISQNVTRTTSLTQQQVNQLNPNSLMKNNQVDLADSEHIDITKSTFHAFYGTGQQNQALAPGGTAAGYAATANKSSSAFSFSGQPNRGSGGFEPIPEGQANRISGGSIYDYDQLRKDY